METEAGAARSRYNKRSAATLVICVLVAVCVILLFHVRVAGGYLSTAPSNGQSLISSPKEYNMTSELASCASADRTRWVALGCTLEAVANETIRGGRPVNEKNMYVDETHRVLYCFVPKMACTTFKAVMVASLSGVALADILPAPGDNPADNLSMIHRGGTLKKAGVQFFHKYTAKQKERVLKTDYFKFIVVRHPFGRLYSAYKDKVERLRKDGGIFPVMRRHRDAITAYGMTQGMGPLYEDNSFIANFTQFVQLVAAGYEARWMYSDHWAVIADQCDPCSTKYDHIIRLETMDQDDVAAVLSRMPGPDGKPYQLPVLNQSVRKPKSLGDNMAAIRTAYTEVDDVTIERLIGIYHRDFELFGYTWDTQKRQAGCSFVRQPMDSYQTPPRCC